jgi:hypothetical protein
MESIEIRIADALAASLRAATFTGALNCSSAKRRFVPDENVAASAGLQVSVVPGAVEVSNLTHGADLFEPQIHVVLARKFASDADIVALIELRTQIVDAIRSDKLPAATPAMPAGVVWMQVTNEVTFDRDAVANQRVFIANIGISYRISQAKMP